MEVVDTEHIRMQQGIQALQDEFLKHEQVPIHLEHRFAHGIYARTIVVPKGTIAIGERQRHSTFNVITKGRIRMYDGPGSPGVEISAPYIYVSNPGDKKVGEFIEESEWTSVHANPTEERDRKKLEDIMLLPESDYIDWLTGDKGEIE